MMTREQAIKLLEYPIYKWSMDWDEREDGLNYSEVIELAISALRPVSREQVEEAFPGCEMCKEKAAGWRCVGQAGGLRWTGKRRPTVDLYPAQMKIKFEIDDGKCPPEGEEDT